MRHIVVVGAGPAGMAAAVRAAEAGARVTVIDDNSSPGGQIWRGEFPLRGGKQAAQWFERFLRAGVAMQKGARVVWGDVHRNRLFVEQAEGPFEISYDRLILATGARELFLPFPGWTLPGIAGVGGLQALAKGGLPLERKRVAVAGSGPLLLAAAHYFRKHGAELVLIAEQAPLTALTGFGIELMRQPAKLAQAVDLQLGLLGVPYWRSTWVERAEGRDKLERLHFRSGNRIFSEDVDCAAIAYGLYPNNELPIALGCAMEGAFVVVNEAQRTSLDNIYSAGEGTGIGGVDLSIIEGQIAGMAAAGHSDGEQRLYARLHARLHAQRHTHRRFAFALNKAFAMRPDLKTLPRPDTIVCRCEDVSYGRLVDLPSFRAAKLHTRCGMGACQGRVCGAAADFLFGWRNESIRPPIFPTRIGSLTL